MAHIAWRGIRRAFDRRVTRSTPPPFRTTYDVVFAIPGAAAHSSGLCSLGRDLGACLGGTALISGDAGYVRGEGAARFALRLDPRAVTGTLLAHLERIAGSHGSPGIRGGRTPPGSEDEAAAFLAPCSPLIRDIPTPDHLGVMLAEALGLSVEPRAGRAVAPPRLRYRRGDEWLAGRLCRIGEDGALIAAAAPPRIGDRLEVELSTPGGPLVIPAVTSHIASSRAAAALGSAGFSARFAFPSAGELRAAASAIAGLRRRLARAELPPRRRELRYPLKWPALTHTGEGRVALWLRDVSRRGLFAEGVPARVGARVAIEAAFDDGARASISGRVTRTGRAGFGLELDALAPEAGRAYDAFVSRVAARAGRRVAIGAAPWRLEELADALRAAGYAVRGADTTRGLCERAFEGRDRPDLVVVDASLDGGGEARARALCRALATHRVDSVRLDHQPALAARRLIDAALL